MNTTPALSVLPQVYIIDTETTGGSHKDEVIEIAWLKIANNIAEKQVFDTFQSYYNPTVPIHPEAYKVHGLRKDMLAKHSPVHTLRLPILLDIAVMHNAVFDCRMLDYKGRSICTLKLVKKIEKLKHIKIGENHKLRTLCELFDPLAVRRTHYHNAVDDCYMTLAVLHGLLSYLPHIDTLEQLEAWCN